MQLAAAADATKRNLRRAKCMFDVSTLESRSGCGWVRTIIRPAPPAGIELESDGDESSDEGVALATHMCDPR